MHNNKAIDYDDVYSNIINDLLNFIARVKEIDDGESLLSIIETYARKRDLDIELVGDAIANDEYLKTIIARDCKSKRIFTSKQAKTDSVDW